MSSLDQLINIQISQQTSAVPQASFSIPLIVGPTSPTSGGPAVVYTSPAGMLTNGYTTGSPEYVYALEMFEQPFTPTEFVVAHRAAAVEQIDTLMVATVTTGHAYAFTMNGVVISYTASGGDSYAQILAGLQAAVTSAFPTPVVTMVISGSGSGSELTLTSSVPGQAVTYSAIDVLLTHVAVTPNYGIQNDINAIIAANDLWYGMCLTQGTDADILQAAALIQSLKKIFIAVSSTSAIATSSSTDIGSVMKAKTYTRSALIFTSEPSEGKDAGWLGGQLPAVPGSNNWAFKTLVGCTPDNLSANQQSILIGDPVAGVAGKNVNIYQTVGGVNITQMGTMASGQFIDITVGVDWLESTLQTNIYTALVQSQKIPYTDIGTSILISAVRAAIDLGITNGLIDGNSPVVISAPSVLSVPSSQRANRIAPTISFSCRLAGAFNAAQVSGTVTV